MEQNRPEFYDILPKDALVDCFDIEVLDDNYPIQIVSTGLKDILIPIKDQASLNEMKPDFKEIKKVSKQYGVVGMHLYAVSDYRMICRNFAPLYDINEESATGTSNGALACYLYEKHGMHKPLYVFEQGYSLDAPSEIHVRLTTNINNEIDEVHVGGQGYYCETIHLNLENII
ncbi:hypothetical protein JCM19029_02040 [Salinicoccus sesuvii]